MALGLETGKDVNPDEFNEAKKDKLSTGLKKSAKAFQPKQAGKPEKKSLRKGSKSFQKSKFKNDELKKKYETLFLTEEKINFHAIYSIGIT